MKQLLTIFMLLLVSVAYTQRPEPTAQKKIDTDQVSTRALELKEDNGYPLETLMPGNWENRSGEALYVWGEPDGYFFGTNVFNDHGFGQKFEVDDSYFIYGALFWIGFAEGATGNVVFTVWDWDDEEGMPGDTLAQTVVPLANITASGSFEGAFYVEFLDDEGFPVLHSDTIGDYVIGADVTDLDDFVPGEYGIGTFSSEIGDGVGDPLAWIREDDPVGWIPATTYVDDLDIAVFPLVSDEYFNILFPIDFFVDMTGAVYGDGQAFDPDAHEVHISGSFIDWPQPGTLESTKMELVHPNENQMLMEENFDGGEIPAGWQNIDANNTGFSWNVVAAPAYDPAEGHFTAMSESWTQQVGDVDPDNWLITPRMEVPFDDHELHFQVKPQDDSYPAEKYSVLVSTTTDDPESFTEIHTETLSAGGWTEVTLPLAEYEGEHIYIAFRHWDSEGNYQLLLDAIRVTGTPALLYNVSFDNVDVALGFQQYKYFVVEDDPTWDFGEWDGDPNRGINIEAEMAMHDTWGHPVLYDVIFDVVDEAGEPIEDATITFAGHENDPGEYDFEAIWGDFSYVVEREGYQSVQGSIEVAEDHAEIVELKLYRDITITVKDEADDMIPGVFVLLYAPEGVFVGQEDETGQHFEGFVAGEYDILITDFFTGHRFANHYGSISIPSDVETTHHHIEEVLAPGYQVEFTVDMNGATFLDHNDNEIAFNPDAHDVYVSASIPSWAGAPGWPDYVFGEMVEWPLPGGADAQLLGYKLNPAGSETTIYHTNFDTWLPDGWSLEQLGTAETNWLPHTAIGGIEQGAVHFWHEGDHNSWLISGGIELDALDHPDAYYLLSFEDFGFEMDWYDYSGVYISDGSGDPADNDFVEIYEADGAVDSWNAVEIDISDFAGETIYLAFVYHGNYAHLWAVDNVEIAEIIPGEPGFYTSDLLNIAAPGDFEYKYYVVRDGVPTWEHGEYPEEGHNRAFSVVDNHVLLEDVWGEQPYHVTFNVDMTMAVEDGDFDPDSDVVYVTGSHIGWAEPGSEKQHQHLTQVEDTHVYTITVPVTAGDYEYKYFINDGWEGDEWPGDPNRVFAVEEEDLTLHDMFGDITFDTPDIAGLDLDIFPNPARDQVTVNSSEMINTVEIFNLTGHRLHEIRPNAQSVQVNVSGLGLGVYIMRIHTENGVAHHKIQVIN